MLLQTNSYIVPSHKHEEHARLMRRFRQILSRLGCDQFEVYEQVAANFAPLKGSTRFVQIMRFRDRAQQQGVQAAERDDSAAQDLVRDFCELVDIEYQREHSLFAVGYYASLIASASDAADASAPAPPVAGAVEPPATAESRDFTTADLDPAAQQQAAANLESRDSPPPASDEPNPRTS